MNTANPFPGMIPYLEGSWADVHTALIGCIREALSEVLPPDLTVRAEEAVTVGCPDGDRALSYRTDVSISRVDRDRTRGLPEIGWVSSGPTIEVAQPVILEVEPPT